MNILILCPMKAECLNMLSSIPLDTKNTYKVVCCGVGKASAAATASLEIGVDPSAYDLIVDIGYAAGSIYYSQGDLVFPTTAQYHDVSVPEGLVPELTQLYELQGSDPCTIFTGDSFVNADSIKEIRSRFNCRNCLFDMEATAIAQVAYEYKIPFLVLKMVSDVPESGDTAQSFNEFVDTHSDFTPFLNYLETLV